MLVLSRRESESLHIGDEIVVHVRRVAGSRVTLAVDAPRAVRVLRGELKDYTPPSERPTEDES